MDLDSNAHGPVEKTQLVGRLAVGWSSAEAGTRYSRQIHRSQSHLVMAAGLGTSYYFQFLILTFSPPSSRCLYFYGVQIVPEITKVGNLNTA